MATFVIVVIILVLVLITLVGGLGSMVCIGVAMKTLLKGEKPRADAQETDDRESTSEPVP